MPRGVEDDKEWNLPSIAVVYVDLLTFHASLFWVSQNALTLGIYAVGSLDVARRHDRHGVCWVGREIEGLSMSSSRRVTLKVPRRGSIRVPVIGQRRDRFINRTRVRSYTRTAQQPPHTAAREGREHE